MNLNNSILNNKIFYPYFDQSISIEWNKVFQFGNLDLMKMFILHLMILLMFNLLHLL